ncbi:hypothetical protein FOL46_001845, partial [Perkinsus olseni]
LESSGLGGSDIPTSSPLGDGLGLEYSKLVRGTAALAVPAAKREDIREVIELRQVSGWVDREVTSRSTHNCYDESDCPQLWSSIIAQGRARSPQHTQRGEADSGWVCYLEMLAIACAILGIELVMNNVAADLLITPLPGDMTGEGAGCHPDSKAVREFRAATESERQAKRAALLANSIREPTERSYQAAINHYERLHGKYISAVRTTMEVLLGTTFSKEEMSLIERGVKGGQARLAHRARPPKSTGVLLDEAVKALTRMKPSPDSLDREIRDAALTATCLVLRYDN